MSLRRTVSKLIAFVQFVHVRTSRADVTRVYALEMLCRDDVCMRKLDDHDACSAMPSMHQFSPPIAPRGRRVPTFPCI